MAIFHDKRFACKGIRCRSGLRASHGIVTDYFRDPTMSVIMADRTVACITIQIKSDIACQQPLGIHTAAFLAGKATEVQESIVVIIVHCVKDG